METIAKLGGRKFILALFSLVCVVVAAKWNVDLKPYENIVVGTLGTYLIGQGLADGLSGGKTSSNPPEVK